MPKQWSCKWIFCLLPCMALTSESPFEVFSLGNINPCNFRSGVPSLSGTLALHWRISKTVRKPQCCPPVIRIFCVHPYEVKQCLLNEDLSHFNCLRREKEGRVAETRWLVEDWKRETEEGFVFVLQMQLVTIMRRRPGKNTVMSEIHHCEDVWNGLCLCLCNHFRQGGLCCGFN